MADIKISELPAAATLDGSEEVPIVQGGVTVRSTMGATVPLGSGAYVPLSGAKEWLAAERFTLNTGTPVLNKTGGGARFVGWQFDAATTEQVNGTYVSPTGWLTCAADLYWSNSGAGAGDVRWSVNISQRGSGDDLNNGDLAIMNSVVVAAPLLDIVKVTTSDTFTIDAAKPMAHLRITRLGADASDTLANDAVVFGVMLRRIT